MENHPIVARALRAKPLRSSAGAFDLPSILVGVVVVGILTAGVLAAIFGVIPWAQDRAAKQDLAAINTAQGVTYAKDGQTYKDLAGLEDARLVSGLDPDKTEVTVSKKGKGFAAAVLSGSGTRWCITNEDTDPSECQAPAVPGQWSTDGWASEYCTPAVVSVYKAQLEAMSDPNYYEYVKAGYGEPFDADKATAWVESMMAAEANMPALSDEESDTVFDAQITTPIYGLFMELMNPYPEDLHKIPAAQAVIGSKVSAELAKFCQSYRGGLIEVDKHPSRVDAFDPRIQAFTGSEESITIGFTSWGADPEKMETRLEGAERIPGFKSAVSDMEMVDGEPYWTYTLKPGSDGWGASSETYDMTVTAARKGQLDQEGAATGIWQVKANSNVIRIVESNAPDASKVEGMPWDSRIGGIYGAGCMRYEIEQPNGTVSFERDAFVYMENVESSEGMRASAHDSESESCIWMSPYTDSLPGTLKSKQVVVSPATFARDEHIYTFTLIGKDEISLEPSIDEPKYAAGDPSTSTTRVHLPDSVDPSYLYVGIEYEGEVRGTGSSWREIYLGDGNSLEVVFKDWYDKDPERPGTIYPYFDIVSTNNTGHSRTVKVTLTYNVLDYYDPVVKTFDVTVP